MVEINLRYGGGLHCSAIHAPSQAALDTDAPADNMGRGEAFSPTDLAAAALGTCVATTMAIAGDRKGVELTGLTVRVRKHMTASAPRRIAKLEIEVRVPLAADHPERAVLEAAGTGCPVRRSLHPEVEIVEKYRWGTGAE